MPAGHDAQVWSQNIRSSLANSCLQSSLWALKRITPAPLHASQWCGTSELVRSRKSALCQKNDGKSSAAALHDGVFVGVTWGKRQCGWEVLFFFAVCEQWGQSQRMLRNVSIISVYHWPCYHAPYTQQRLIHIWWGWNWGLFCYKAVNGIRNAKPDWKF